MTRTVVTVAPDDDAVARRAADGVIVRRAPTSLVPGASRRSIPSFSRETEKGERAGPAAQNVKWPGSMALAMRLFDK